MKYIDTINLFKRLLKRFIIILDEDKLDGSYRKHTLYLRHITIHSQVLQYEEFWYNMVFWNYSGIMVKN